MSQKKSRLTEYQRPLWLDVVNWFLKLPRLARIVVIACFALAMTLVLTPVIDYTYMSYLFTEQTRLLPSLISAAAGILMYLFGWWLVIGAVNEKPPARLLTLVYLILGIGVVCLALVLTLMGFTSASMPTT